MSSLTVNRQSTTWPKNDDLFTEMIRAQNRRELDPAMMAVPTFSGKEPEKCLDLDKQNKKHLQPVGMGTTSGND